MIYLITEDLMFSIRTLPNLSIITHVVQLKDKIQLDEMHLAGLFRFSQKQLSYKGFY